MAYVDRPEPMSPRLRHAADTIVKDTSGPDFWEVLHRAGYRSISEVDTDVDIKVFTSKFRGAASRCMAESLYVKAEMHQDAQVRKTTYAADDFSPQRPTKASVYRDRGAMVAEPDASRPSKARRFDRTRDFGASFSRGTTSSSSASGSLPPVHVSTGEEAKAWTASNNLWSIFLSLGVASTLWQAYE